MSGRLLSRIASAGALVALAILLAAPTSAALASSRAPAPSAPTAVPGYSGILGAPAAASPATVAPRVAHAAAEPARTTASERSVGPAWSNSNFFSDAQVTFALPGYGTLSNFSTVPIPNSIPRYADGFWMNVTTDRPLVYANVTIWGTQWPLQNRTAPIPGFSPQGPPTYPMDVNSSSPEKAAFYFDDYRFFWPGSTFAFNVSLTALNSTPATISSASGRYAEPFPVQYNDQATWIVTVAGPWVSPQFNSSIDLYTSPNVLGVPPFDPNPDQPLQVYLTALASPGQPVGTIPAAQITYTVNRSGGSLQGTENFFPLNHTTVFLPQPLGPYPNSTVKFNVTLWLPWQAGAIDRLYSPEYTFNWSPNGGFLYPTEGLLANMQLFTTPALAPLVPATIASGVPVNVTIHEPTENVSIASGQVNYVFRDGYGYHRGTLAMSAISLNTSYVEIPGLPPQSHLTFFVSAKDIYGNPVFSENFTYSATKSFVSTPPAGQSLFFFEVLDLSGSGFVPSLNFTLSNTTWSETRIAEPLGFGAPLVPGFNGYLNVSPGPYVLTVSAFGRTFSTIVTVSNQTPFTVVFYTASAPIAEATESALPVVPIAAVIGLLAGSLSLAIILPWFLDRRKRIEEEQRRITL